MSVWPLLAAAALSLAQTAWSYWVPVYSYAHAITDVVCAILVLIAVERRLT